MNCAATRSGVTHEYRAEVCHPRNLVNWCLLLVGVCGWLPSNIRMTASVREERKRQDEGPDLACKILCETNAKGS